MRLLRIGEPGAETPALLHEDGSFRDISGLVDDLAGETVSLTSLDRIRAADPDRLPEISPEGRIGPCIATTPTFHCIGLNYRKHAEEAGMAPPGEPILFTKAASALCGPNDPIIRPKDSEKLDYEVELGVVIGEVCEHVSEAEALSRVAGYCVVNDVSERAYQIERLGQWVKGKSAPNFGPVGPWLVTADEVPDPQALKCWLDVNDDTRQLSMTSDMIFSVAEIISYMSRFMRLVPGDLIATGTPEGVAMGMTPPGWLVPGDVVSLGIDGLGEQRQDVVAYPGA
ncbi:MAG: fumarylacetoacetate hydrolase family protein [Rhodobacteraceae bacterium]|nr:fumarylacetoacetate hydrolase family protein [Paracoccaceae bacterium]